MKIRKLPKLFTLLAAIMLSAPLAAVAADGKENSNSYRDALNDADANFRAALASCDKLRKEARENCREEAEDSLEKQRRQAERQREAGYEAALEKCEPLHFNAQDSCEKDAAETYGKNH
jgi:ABC-type transporter Mla subunit MlaD